MVTNDYTQEPIGALSGHGRIVRCPGCGRNGARRDLVGGSHLIVHLEEFSPADRVVRDSCAWDERGVYRPIPEPETPEAKAPQERG
jgi:hypothetical protein